MAVLRGLAQVASVAHGDELCFCTWPGPVVPAPSNVTMTAVSLKVTLETDKKRVPQFLEDSEVTSTLPPGGLDHLAPETVDDYITDLLVEDIDGLDKHAQGGVNWIRDEEREHRRGWLYCDNVVVHVYHRKAGAAGRPMRRKPSGF